jgi:hypothetical protein
MDAARQEWCRSRHAMRCMVRTTKYIGSEKLGKFSLLCVNLIPGNFTNLTFHSDAYVLDEQELKFHAVQTFLLDIQPPSPIILPTHLSAQPFSLPM